MTSVFGLKFPFTVEVNIIKSPVKVSFNYYQSFSTSVEQIDDFFIQLFQTS